MNAGLETRRLRLEALVEDHADELFEPLSDPRLYAYIPGDPPHSLQTLRDRYSKLSTRVSPDGRESWLNWAMRERTCGECVGLLEATIVEKRRAGIAYFVLTPHQRMGYGREGGRWLIEHLFRTWGVRTITADIDTRNEASIRLVRSLGFERVSRTPCADAFKGSVSDEYRFELRGPPVRHVR